MRSAYTDCKWTVRSAKNAGPWLQPHVRERALVQSQTHVTEDPTRCGDKDFRVFFLNGSPVLRNSESRAGFLSTKGHPCTARKVRQALPAWLSRVRSKGLGRSHFFKDFLASASHIPEHRGPWIPACPVASEAGSQPRPFLSSPFQMSLFCFCVPPWWQPELGLGKAGELPA